VPYESEQCGTCCPTNLTAAERSGNHISGRAARWGWPTSVPGRTCRHTRQLEARLCWGRPLWDCPRAHGQCCGQPRRRVRPWRHDLGQQHVRQCRLAAMARRRIEHRRGSVSTRLRRPHRPKGLSAPRRRRRWRWLWRCARGPCLKAYARRWARRDGPSLHRIGATSTEATYLLHKY
jgi:hypothetical protein